MCIKKVEPKKKEYKQLYCYQLIEDDVMVLDYMDKHREFEINLIKRILDNK